MSREWEHAGQKDGDSHHSVENSLYGFYARICLYSTIAFDTAELKEVKDQLQWREHAKKKSLDNKISRATMTL